MKNRVSIVVCYQSGTAPILEACMSAIYRHTCYKGFDVIVVSREFDTQGADVCLDYDFVQMAQVDIGVPPESSSRVHGMMLDKVVCGLGSELVLTLDSDCFPVADGWLRELVEMIDGRNGFQADVAGILHPWGPPPDDMDRKKIEWRVRNQHCWYTTHVACQLVRRSFIENNNLKYNDGDDTGLTIPMAVREGWGRVDGYKVTRCPRPEMVDGHDIDPEFNRYICLVFGDKVYHHGGYTRTTTFGDKPELERAFGWARKRVIAERSADFLLEDRLSYKFSLDREEEIAAEKMQRLFGLKSQRMDIG